MPELHVHVIPFFILFQVFFSKSILGFVFAKENWYSWREYIGDRCKFGRGRGENMILKLNKSIYVLAFLLGGCPLPFEKQMYSVPVDIVNGYNDVVYLSPAQITYAYNVDGVVAGR